jgi:hypothetical protein
MDKGAIVRDKVGGVRVASVRLVGVGLVGSLRRSISDKRFELLVDML